MAKRTDPNQAEIMAALRKAGAHVTSLHTVGKGCPDLLVSYHGKWFVIEVKGPKGKRTPDQTKWSQEAKAPVWLARTSVEALAAIYGGMSL